MDDQLVRDRDAAWALLTEWTQSEALRRHALAVEASVRAYAGSFDEDADTWGYPEWFIRAIQSHGDHTGVARESQLERTLYACDEVSGFVHACGLVRPDGLTSLEAKSVRKKLKQPSFAKGVNRDDVVQGAEQLGVDLDEHITFVIAALRPISAELGLRS
jgi:predicted hydrolase (HD superfamily)